MKIILWLSVSSALSLAMEQEQISNTTSSSTGHLIISNEEKDITPIMIEAKNNITLFTEEKDIKPTRGQSSSTKLDNNKDTFLNGSMVAKWMIRLTTIDSSAHSKNNRENTLKNEDIDNQWFWLQNGYVIPDEETNQKLQNIINKLSEKKQRRNEKKESKVKEKKESVKSYNVLKTNLMKLLGHRDNKKVSKNQFDTQFIQFKNHINAKVDFYANMMNVFVDCKKKEWSDIPILKDLQLYLEITTKNSDSPPIEKKLEDENSNLNEVFHQKTKEQAKKELEKFLDHLKAKQKEVTEIKPREKYNKWSQRSRFVNYE